MPKGYHHLTRDQRCQLYTLKKRGDSVLKISQEIDVHRSAIYRELRRNSGRRGYRFKQANEKSVKRRQEASRPRSKMTPSLISIIEEKLSLQWSPVQVSGWIKRHDTSRAISHESIYRYIWANKKNGGGLYKNLRHSGKKYNKRSKGRAGRGCIPNRVDIKERPPVVDEKTRLGDWELDTIVGTGQSGAIVSMVDRRSKITFLVKTTGRTSAEVTQALLSRLLKIKGIVHTLTADNGKEFARHQAISEALGTKFYFATPYHSWERGLNEHTNGLVRQYFPKFKRFDEISDEELMEVEMLLNNRPRKVLDFETPVEVFDRLKRAA